MILESQHHPGRPLVVLAGWLGCQPKSLRKFEKLYSQELGWSLLSVIAPPLLVAKSARCIPPALPRTWPNQASGNPSTTHDLAWRVLSRVEKIPTSNFFVHVFSNGGYFVWEEMDRILGSSQQYSNRKGVSLDERSGTRLEALKQKLSGVILDSAPAWYSMEGDGLNLAMQHCSLRDRLQYWLWSLRQNDEEYRKRAIDFWDGCKRDPGVPQLFLYSRNDPLTSAEPLEDLIRYRQEQFGRILQVQKWDDPRHVAHFSLHPEEYTAAITKFAGRCLSPETDGTTPGTRSRL